MMTAQVEVGAMRRQSAVPAPQIADTARMVRDALAETGASQEMLADGCGVSRSKAQQWVSGSCSPNMGHLARLITARPTLARALLSRLESLLPAVAHVRRALPDRVCSVLSEVGDVAREVSKATADGTVDSEERARIRREISEARAALDALERDLDS